MAAKFYLDLSFQIFRLFLLGWVINLSIFLYFTLYRAFTQVYLSRRTK